MSYQALARKYRPQTFSDILGQESIVRTLENSIRDQRIHQAYLFSGVRGVGKTTTARIFAKALNCVEGPTTTPCNVCSICREITEGIDLDVREIDAATYTQVDNVRELREVTQFQPARDRNRIFIIDEAHMLSNQAWNALLKLIEEPPPHVVFMMATTEMHKVPQTILSRVQQFVFRTVTTAELASRLQEICESEGIEASSDAVEMIARRGDGSVRDSLSLLDQIVAFCGQTVDAAAVATVLGLSDRRFFSSLVRHINDGNHAGIIEIMEEAAESGRDFKLLYRDLLAFLRSMLLLASGADESLLRMEPDEREDVRASASLFDSTEILRLINLMLRDDELIQRSEQQRLAVEIAILKAATLPRLRAVEDALAGSGGESTSAGAPRRPPAGPSAEKRARSSRPSKEPEEGATDSPERLCKRIADETGKERRMTGHYLGMSKAIRRENDLLVFEFDSTESFIVEQLREEEHLRLVESVSSRLLGTPCRIRFDVRGVAQAKQEETRSAIEQDPVIQSFARHLGGEVIPSPVKRNRETP